MARGTFEDNRLRKKRIARAVRKQHRDPEWRARWERGNVLGKLKAMALRAVVEQQI